MSAAPTLHNQTFHDFVSGPVDDARLGRTIVVNPFGSQAKICSFNCGYCDLGFTETRLNKLKETGFLPSASDILSAVRDQLKACHENGPALHAIVISGKGEPTLHPDFPTLIAGLIELRDLWLKGQPLVVLTNGANLDQRKIVDALNRVDERVVKIDAGNERVFKTLNSPIARVSLGKIISGLKGLKDATIQSLFCQGALDNTEAADLEDWIEVVAMLKPKKVLIQTASRTPAMSGLRACDEDTLHMIASKLERRSGIRATVLG